MTVARETFDVIVAGGGAAGCVVAARLSDDPRRRVLLLEAGGDERSLDVRIPGAFFRLHGTGRRFEYLTEPEPAAGNRRLPVPQGRMLGGGGSVNGMIYIRGQREDYDAWRDAGCAGWGFDDVLPFFRRSEDNLRLAGTYHGTDGPLGVCDPQDPHPLGSAFVRAAMELGEAGGRPIRFNADFNGATQEGVGFYQRTIRAGERSSAASAFLRPAMSRPNLVVRTGAHVARVVVENGRAAGVEYLAGGARRRADARAEVVVSAGAIGTPKILLLSGIGPGASLQSMGIPVVIDSPGVGANYHDHLLVSVMSRTKGPISLFGHERGWNAAKHLAHWLLFRGGPLASNVLEAGGFFDLDGDGRPEVQMHLVPRLPYAPGQPGGEHGYTVSAYALVNRSRGTVRLVDRDPMSPPKLNANYLSDVADVRLLMAGFRLARRIVGAPSLARLTAAEIGASAGVSSDDDAGLEALVRAQARTVYHPVGTCRMGADAASVVDPQLRLRGIGGLRIGDASIIPEIPRGNTHAPSIMIGERAAEFARSV